MRFEEIKELEKSILDRGNSKGKIVEVGKSLVFWELERTLVYCDEYRDSVM